MLLLLKKRGLKITYLYAFEIMYCINIGISGKQPLWHNGSTESTSTRESLVTPRASLLG